VGKLNGGQGRNVIPPEATLAMETRGETSELDDYMTTEARRIIEAAAAMWGCSFDVKVMGGTKSGESSESMVADVEAIAKTMPQFTNIQGTLDFGASEDYSHMMAVVQKAGGKANYVQVGTTRAAGHHNDHFDFDEDRLATSAELLVRMAVKYNGK
jgi:aminobenzoyl-glutamate utilization protein A